jgi:RNA polymerase sigma-70 factor (ECF subfamily)
VAEQEHAAAALQRAVAELSLPLKQVMSLALEGLGTGEIAEVLGISESNAAVRLHRGKALVRARLGGQHG